MLTLSESIVKVPTIKAFASAHVLKPVVPPVVVANGKFGTMNITIVQGDILGVQEADALLNPIDDSKKMNTALGRAIAKYGR